MKQLSQKLTKKKPNKEFPEPSPDFFALGADGFLEKPDTQRDKSADLSRCKLTGVTA